MINTKKPSGKVRTGQQLIEYYRELGVSANKINAAGPRNVNTPSYLKAA
jgi:hypothetical protein